MRNMQCSWRLRWFIATRTRYYCLAVRYADGKAIVIAANIAGSIDMLTLDKPIPDFRLLTPVPQSLLSAGLRCDIRCILDSLPCTTCLCAQHKSQFVKDDEYTPILPVIGND